MFEDRKERMILECPDHGPQIEIRRVRTNVVGHLTNQPVLINGRKCVPTAKVCPICRRSLELMK